MVVVVFLLTQIITLDTGLRLSTRRRHDLSEKKDRRSQAPQASATGQQMIHFLPLETEPRSLRLFDPATNNPQYLLPYLETNPHSAQYRPLPYHALLSFPDALGFASSSYPLNWVEQWQTFDHEILVPCIPIVP